MHGILCEGSSAVRGSMLPEGVQDALNVREVEFHRCLDGDRLLQREDRVGGRCCESFNTLSQLRFVFPRFVSWHAWNPETVEV